MNKNADNRYIHVNSVLLILNYTSNKTTQQQTNKKLLTKEDID